MYTLNAARAAFEETIKGICTTMGLALAVASLQYNML
jgi:hypothetical protein